VSATACTSLSLCEMKMTGRPLSRSARMIRNRSPVSAGVSTEVGSPSRAWIRPGATERSMWSLATRLPKRSM